MSLVSDKVIRGISQTRGRATVQFDLNLHSDTGWTAGLGLAPLRLGGDAAASSDAEVFLSLGRGWQLDADWSVQAGLARYTYPGRGRRSRDYDYTELAATLGWGGRVFATATLSPDVSAFDADRGLRRGTASSLELTGRQRLCGPLALDAGIGYYDLSAVRNRGYRYGSIGLSWGHGPMQAYLARIASTARQRGIAPADVSGNRWAASLLWNF